MSKKKIGRPAKPAAKKKSHFLQVRVNEVESATFDAASDLAGLEKSAWVRERLLTVARAELRKAGKDVP